MTKKKITTRKKTKTRVTGRAIVHKPARYDLDEENYDVINRGLPPPKYLRSRHVDILTACSWAVQDYIRLRDPALRALHKKQVEEMVMDRLATMVKKGTDATALLAAQALASLQDMDKIHAVGLTKVTVKALDAFVSKHIADTQADVARRDLGTEEQSITTIFSEAFIRMEAAGKVMVDKEILAAHYVKKSKR